MHDLSVIKHAALDALDEDSEIPEAMRMAGFHSIVDPGSVYEMACLIEQSAETPETGELMQLFRELAEYVEKLPGEEARVLAMKARDFLPSYK